MFILTIILTQQLGISNKKYPAKGSENMSYQFFAFFLFNVLLSKYSFYISFTNKHLNDVNSKIRSTEVPNIYELFF